MQTSNAETPQQWSTDHCCPLCLLAAVALFSLCHTRSTKSKAQLKTALNLKILKKSIFLQLCQCHLTTWDFYRYCLTYSTLVVCTSLLSSFSFVSLLTFSHDSVKIEYFNMWRPNRHEQAQNRFFFLSPKCGELPGSQFTTL